MTSKVVPSAAPRRLSAFQVAGDSSENVSTRAGAVLRGCTNGLYRSSAVRADHEQSFRRNSRCKMPERFTSSPGCGNNRSGPARHSGWPHTSETGPESSAEIRSTRPQTGLPSPAIRRCPDRSIRRRCRPRVRASRRRVTAVIAAVVLLPCVPAMPIPRRLASTPQGLGCTTALGCPGRGPRRLRIFGRDRSAVNHQFGAPRNMLGAWPL